jgi:hypothetical protein
VQALVQHRTGRAAAVIAHTIEIQQIDESRVQRARMNHIVAQAHRAQIVIAVFVRQVSENLAAVRSLPPEDLERERIGLVVP